MFENYPDIMSVSEAAKALGIGRNKLYELIRTGELRSFKNGRNIKVPKHFLMSYIDKACYNANYITAYESPERRVYGDK